MSEEVNLYALPSGLFIEKRRYDDGETRHYILNKGWDEWHRGVRYYVTKEEYDALLPLAKRVEE